MVIILIVLICIVLITGYITGNFLFELALNPKSSKAVIFNNDDLAEKEQMKIENNKWLEENASDVYIESKKLRLHSYEVKAEKESKVWVIAVHGYTDSAYFMVGAAKKFLHYGYNVLMPDLRAHGKSEGKYIGMGWLDRLDLMQWIDYLIATYGNIKIILYGISMGAATVMMASGERLPSNVRAIIEDCGYTSVWDIFESELDKRFSLPTFPVLNISNGVAKLKAGYDFKEASSVDQLKKCQKPMLFIHGGKDDFVPTYMVYEVYDAANCEKDLYIVDEAGHAEAKDCDVDAYWNKVFSFINEKMDI